jgi:hypothetical protein
MQVASAMAEGIDTQCLALISGVKRDGRWQILESAAIRNYWANASNARIGPCAQIHPSCAVAVWVIMRSASETFRTPTPA